PCASNFAWLKPVTQVRWLPASRSHHANRTVRSRPRSQCADRCGRRLHRLHVLHVHGLVLGEEDAQAEAAPQTGGHAAGDQIAIDSVGGTARYGWHDGFWKLVTTAL